MLNITVARQAPVTIWCEVYRLGFPKLLIGFVWRNLQIHGVGVGAIPPGGWSNSVWNSVLFTHGQPLPAVILDVFRYNFQTRLFMVPNIAESFTLEGAILIAQNPGSSFPPGENWAKSQSITSHTGSLVAWSVPFTVATAHQIAFLAAASTPLKKSSFSSAVTRAMVNVPYELFSL
jgi:hypothetical protein